MEIDEALKDAAFRRTGVLGELIDEVIAFQSPGDGGPSAADVSLAATEAFLWSMPYLASLASGRELTRL